jgi:hypothetical protein
MFIIKKDAIIVVILITLGMVNLVFGERFFGWTELIRGNIFTFFGAIAVMFSSMAFEKWHKQKLYAEKRAGIIKGIYQEIIERTRYLKQYVEVCAETRTPHIVCMNKYSSSAWQSAINEGYFDPEHQFWTDCEFVYQSADQLNYEMDRANTIYYQSTLDKGTVMNQLIEMNSNWISLIERTQIIADSVIQNIEEELNISHQQMLRLNKELYARIELTIQDRNKAILAHSEKTS